MIVLNNMNNYNSYEKDYDYHDLSFNNINSINHIENTTQTNNGNNNSNNSLNFNNLNMNLHSRTDGGKENETMSNFNDGQHDTPDKQSNEEDSSVNENTGDRKKSIPIELTAYGTTPSGKPRLFVCQVCTRAFARLEHLRRHERSHTKEKPFTCGVCQRKFSRRDLLLRHAQKLHAGCADAITRLRRKSVKKSEDSRGNTPLPKSSKDNEDDSHSSTLMTPSNSLASDVQFNLNLFDSNSSINNHLSKLQNFGKRRSNSDLSKQLFDKKRIRGASFSAQSGANYAANNLEFNELYTGSTDSVEFLTPQLIPTSSYDEPTWLQNLSTIPGMNEDSNNHIPKRNNSVNHNGKMSRSHSRQEGIDESNDKNYKLQSNKFDLNLQYMMPTVTMNANEINNNNSKDVGFGYSFYDIPDSMISKNFETEYKSNNVLTPIKQEFEGEDSNNAHNNFNHKHHDEIFDVNLNFINDIGDLTNEIDVNSKFLPNGYSFYGDSVSSSAIDNGSNYNSPNNYLNQTQLSTIENTTNLTNLKINYSTNILFTNNIRNLINKSLNKYPINGSINPIIPSNDKLENYSNIFKVKFLSRFPFIHNSRLNEFEIMKMTNTEDFNNESSRVCLPLLVSTIGALLSNNKNDSEHLYEASRRTIHIYLETRKHNNQTKSNNPLWLIQSLTLSVIYGLFSDNENNVLIVIRQLNALNSLVKTSIKDQKNSQIFKINQVNINENEIEFNKLINSQSQSRIIFMIYRLTNFLLMFYNIPLTLSVNDLNNLELPNKQDEIIWKFGNFNEFNKSNLKINNFKRLYFKDLLLKISKNANNDLLKIVELQNLSLYSYTTLIHGIYEINQFNNNLNIGNISNNLIKLFNQSINYDYKSSMLNEYGIKLMNSKQINDNYELIDFSILINLIKISSILDFKSLKQQSWLKNYQELIKNYEILVNSIKLNEFSKIDKILDYSLNILEFIIVKFDKFDNNEPSVDTSSEDSNGEEEISYQDLMNIKFNDVLNNDPNLILSQSLFHVFAILSVIFLQILKTNKNHFINQLIIKFNKIFKFCKFIQINYNLPIIFEIPSVLNNNDNNNNNNSLNYYDVYYLLNVGELLLSHYYNNFLKFSIFEKLSINLYQIRKFLSDNENKFSR